MIRYNEVHNQGFNETSNSAIYVFSNTGAAINATVLGNLVYNVANLLNPGNTTSLLFLLTELAAL